MSFLLCRKRKVLGAINWKCTNTALSLAVCSLMFKDAKFTKFPNVMVLLYII